MRHSRRTAQLNLRNNVGPSHIDLTGRRQQGLSELFAHAEGLIEPKKDDVM